VIAANGWEPDEMKRLVASTLAASNPSSISSALSRMSAGRFAYSGRRTCTPSSSARLRKGIDHCKRRSLMFGISKGSARVDGPHQNQPESSARVSKREAQRYSGSAGNTTHNSSIHANVIKEKHDIVCKLIEGQGSRAP
jgi:hypothetical protein